MKLNKIASLLLVMMLVFGIAAMAHAEVIGGETFKYVKTNTGVGLNVRQEPNSKSPIVDTLPYGARVRIDGYSDNGVWALISYEGARGCYVYTRYLVDKNPGKFNPTPTPTVKPTTSPTDAPKTQVSFDTFKHVKPYQAMVTTGSPTGRVYLRWAPGTAYAYETVCYQGTEITVIAEGAGWYQVMINSNGYVGFMSAKYITKK